MTSTNKICLECGCTTYKLLPDPRDYRQEPRVCEDCEHTIIKNYVPQIDETDPLDKYENKKGT